MDSFAFGVPCGIAKCESRRKLTLFFRFPIVLISLQGKVRNPTGEGVRPISAQAQAKATKVAEWTSTQPQNGEVAHHNGASAHETKVKEGTAKRNITRKKTADKDTGNFNSVFKKQGGHGKAQWQDAMDPSYVEEIPIDEKDPIYDEAEDLQRYILTSTGIDGSTAEKRGYDPNTSKAVYGPLWTLQEFKAQLLECLKEYFDSCDAEEVIRTISELGCPEYHPEIVKKAISLAMDKGPRERELTSRLFTVFPMSMEELQAGFIILLDGMDDLSKDVPDAKVRCNRKHMILWFAMLDLSHAFICRRQTMAASFLARAVVDEVLSPAFLSEQNNCRPGDEVIEKAVTLLSREHCNARLEKVWGPGDGRPVEELKKDMDQLLQEYLLSRELDEAARCVKELDAPHFHHELVKRGVFSAMEMDGGANHASSSDAAFCEAPSNMDAMAALFGFLVRNAIVSEQQVKKGVERLHKLLPDLTLDVPAAPALLEAFEKMALEQGCL
jgi:programmed cell death protein 4